MSSKKDDIRKLLSLINTAGEDIIRQYELADCELPSIDAQHEQRLPEDITTLRRSLQLLEGACYQLCTTLSPPDLTMYTRAFVGVDLACITVAANAKIADILESHPEGLPTSQLAKESGIHEAKLLKILRNLAAKHIFTEVSPGTFANNALSLTLRSHTPMGSMVLIRMNVLGKFGINNMPEALVDPDYGQSFEPNRSAFAYGVRDEHPNGTLFDWLRAHPDWSKLFQHGLRTIASTTMTSAIVKDFPLGSATGNTSLCDVGSGVGALTIQLVKAYPYIRVTLQDLPHVLQQAETTWRKECPEAVENNRVSFKPIDFLKEAPVQDQDIYYIRQVIHDWRPEECIKILANVRKAMKRNSRVLIHEYILPSNIAKAPEDIEDGIDQAPHPLLPNYGYGSTRAYYQDVMMQILLNGGERTLEEYKALGSSAGLRFVKAWNFVETVILEFELDAEQ